MWRRAQTDLCLLTNFDTCTYSTHATPLRYLMPAVDSLVCLDQLEVEKSCAQTRSWTATCRFLVVFGYSRMEEGGLDVWVLYPALRHRTSFTRPGSIDWTLVDFSPCGRLLLIAWQRVAGLIRGLAIHDPSSMTKLFERHWPVDHSRPDALGTCKITASPATWAASASMPLHLHPGATLQILKVHLLVRFHQLQQEWDVDSWNLSATSPGLMSIDRLERGSMASDGRTLVGCSHFGKRIFHLDLDTMRHRAVSTDFSAQICANGDMDMKSCLCPQVGRPCMLASSSGGQIPQRDVMEESVA